MSEASLVIQTSFLGDTVLTTPLLAHLAECGPVDVVTTPASSSLLAHHPAVRRCVVYDKRGAARGARGFVRLASTLRAERYRSVYLAQGSVRSGALALAAGIGDRVGFQTSAGRAFYTTRIAAPENIHHAARLLSLGTRDPLREISNDRLRPTLYPGDAERDAVNRLLESGLATGERLIAVAPGSVWGTKRWPGYAALAVELSHEARVVVIGAESDRTLAAEILAAAPGRAIDATGCLSLLASAELIRRADLLVTNDSLPLHLASAMNTPTVAVFGPTVPEFGFRPLASSAAVAGRAGLACRPCDRHGPRECPLGHWRCMREITPSAVASLARELLRGAGAPPSRTP
jgi:lipopolysaccharide heptosyltransferase II